MGFQKFDRTMAPSGRAPSVTINIRGIISINQSAIIRIGSPDFVDLLYDADERLIGICPSEDAENGHRVRGTDKAGASVLVTGTSFMNHFGIVSTESRRWFPTFDGAIQIDR